MTIFRLKIGILHAENRVRYTHTHTHTHRQLESEHSLTQRENFMRMRINAKNSKKWLKVTKLVQK